MCDERNQVYLVEEVIPSFKTVFDSKREGKLFDLPLFLLFPLLLEFTSSILECGCCMVGNEAADNAARVCRAPHRELPLAVHSLYTLTQRLTLGLGDFVHGIIFLVLGASFCLFCELIIGV